MIRDELIRALETIGDRLPDDGTVVLIRRAHGDHGVIFIRGDVESVTGRPAADFERPTEKWLDVVHPDDRRTVTKQLRRLTDVDEAGLEYRIVDPEGRTRWIQERLRVRRPRPEAMPEIVGVLRDVSSNRSLSARVAGLERDLWRARKLEAVGAMASGIVHDFNNLLTVILGAADLLRREPDIPAEYLDDIMVMRDAALRGSKLVHQILRFSSEGEKGLDALNPGELLGDLETILRKMVGPEVRVSIDRPDRVWPIRADRTHLEQILLNLASNARDAMPGGGVLHIRIANETLVEETRLRSGSLSAGRYVRLTVRDTGRGMSADVLKRAFEPFFSTKSREGEKLHGGYGLTTVLRLVRGYGGGIALDTGEGEGSAFTIYLPVREAGEADRSESTLAAAFDLPEESRGRILLVDANRGGRRVVSDFLEREGYSVLGCGSVAEGLTAFDRVRPPFQLLITDIFLPDRSGHDLWRAARRRVTDLPVIFLSAYDEEAVAQEGIAVSDDPVLSKPVDLEQLQFTVDEVLNRAGKGIHGESSQMEGA